MAPYLGPFVRSAQAHFRLPLPIWLQQRAPGWDQWRKWVWQRRKPDRQASEKRYWGVGAAGFAAMIPPQEASARRREIEDKLKQVGLGLER